MKMRTQINTLFFFYFTNGHTEQVIIYTGLGKIFSRSVGGNGNYYISLEGFLETSDKINMKIDVQHHPCRNPLPPS